MTTIYSKTMGKQINFYLQKADLERIKAYLLKRNCIFIEDIIFDQQNPLLSNHLLSSISSEKYITFPNKEIQYNALKNTKGFRLNQMRSAVMEFGIYGKKNDFYRARFFYEATYSENGERKQKDADFEAFVERFFRWFRRNYTRVPEQPFFFQNPEMPVKELF